MSLEVEKKHPLALRWNHWINFPVLMIMIWSGLMIYWANPAFGLPASWLAQLGMSGRLAEGMAWHFSFAYIFVLNGIAYTLYLIFSKQWKYLIPNRHSFAEAWQVLLHDLGLRKQAPPRPRKYNGAQRVTYSLVWFLGVLASLTGFAIYKPTQLSWLVNLFGGFHALKIQHFVITWCFVLFFVVHVLQVVRAGWNQFRAMITGLEVVDEERGSNES